MRVVFSANAKADLKDIADWISQDSLAAAKRTLHLLQARGLDLRQYPLRFPTIAPNSAIRRRVVNTYVIFYIVEDDHVQIVRVLHGARDYVAIFGTDDPT
jgi:addiction module RelE/StbE family toxin